MEKTDWFEVGAGILVTAASWVGIKRANRARSEDHAEDIETLKAQIASLQQDVEDLRRHSKEKIESVRTELSEVKRGVQEMQYDVEAKIRDTSRQQQRHLVIIENQLRELMALYEVPQQARELPRD